jgi:putative redox protein
MRITHVGGLKFEAEHRGHKLTLDQPVPVGSDEGPTPIELVAAALGGCVAVYGASFLKRNDIPAAGFAVDVVWEMTDKPHRVGRFSVKVTVPHELSRQQRESLARVIQGCPVHHTLETAPHIEYEFEIPTGNA